MIQFNLLPEVKLDYIRAQRTKRVVMVIASLAAMVSVSILILLFVLVNVLQKNHLNNLSSDVTKYTDELKAIPDLDKVLTVQNQLNSLPALHDQKAVVSRLYSYIGKVTPSKVTVSKFTADYVNNTFSIEGEAANLERVNQYADTLKFTEYTTVIGGATGKAFSGVVLTDFSRNIDITTYKIDLAFDPVIFNSADTLTFTVPQITSTRSETEKPNPLFQLNTIESTEQ